jgi:hypothetical protein
VAVLTTSETWVCDYYRPGRRAYFVRTEEFLKLQEIVAKISVPVQAPQVWPTASPHFSPRFGRES